MKEFVVDRRYWISDDEYYSMLSKKRYNTSYLDDYFMKMYRSSNLKQCAFCGGQLYRRVVSHSAGHGESCTCIRFCCFDCPIDIEISATYGNTFQDAEDIYISYCTQLKNVILKDKKG